MSMNNVVSVTPRDQVIIKSAIERNTKAYDSNRRGLLTELNTIDWYDDNSPSTWRFIFPERGTNEMQKELRLAGWYVKTSYYLPRFSRITVLHPSIILESRSWWFRLLH